MNKLRVLIQASSRSWAGGTDICMGLVDGEIAVVRTVKRALSAFPEYEVRLAAPEFDRSGALDQIVSDLNDPRLTAFYGYDESPLKRMLAAAEDLNDEDYILRADGIHFCFDTDLSKEMLALAQSRQLDCVKLPDDFPVHFSSEVFRVGALRKLVTQLQAPEDAKFHVHPKCYFALNRHEFSFEYLLSTPSYSDEYLSECRRLANAIYEIPRQEVNGKRIASGDRLGFHYELALRYLKPNMKVLDIACADGYGVRMSPRVWRKCTEPIWIRKVLPLPKHTHHKRTWISLLKISPPCLLRITAMMRSPALKHWNMYLNVSVSVSSSVLFAPGACWC